MCALNTYHSLSCAVSMMIIDVKNKWEKSSWGRRLIVQQRRAALNDFDRFKLMLAKIKVGYNTLNYCFFNYHNALRCNLIPPAYFTRFELYFELLFLLFDIKFLVHLENFYPAKFFCMLL